MPKMDISCNHIGIACGDTCSCICEICQVAFEEGWSRLTTVKELCGVCGVPLKISVETLKETQPYHFYHGCDTCDPVVKKVLEEAGLCSSCMTNLKDGVCPACTCNKTDSCSCRECRNFQG